MITVYVSIGNSDGKLAQWEWAEFQTAFMARLRIPGRRIHGEWYSLPHSPFQNACVCAEIWPLDADDLKAELTALAAEYRQDSIAWADATTTFLKPGQE